MPKILVTGHTGFVGRALHEALKAEGHEVLGASRSTGQDISLPGALETGAYDSARHVYHVAGRTFVPASWEDPASFYQANALGTQHVLDFCRKRSLPLTFVSAYIYGPPQYLPVDEAHPLAPNNPYAHSKFFAEELCRFYAAHFGLKVAIVRPFNIYGPGQAASFLIPSLMRQAATAERIEVQDLAPRRDYIYLEDIIAALLYFLDGNRARHVEYNLGSGVSHSVEEAARAALAAVGRDIPVVRLGRVRRGEIPDVVADIRRMREDFGWQPNTTLEEGLRELYQHELHKTL